MSVRTTLTLLGGVATAAELRATHSLRAVRAAVARGEIERPARGRYCLSTVSEHRRYAHERSATESHLSAAIQHGWKVKVPPEQPWITVPRNRKLARSTQSEAHCHWAPLSADEVTAGITSHLRTVLDCARTLPFDEALAVADSALRAGDVSSEELVAAAGRLRGPGAVTARRVARCADGRAANPLESVLRAICLGIAGLRVVPQVEISEPGLFAVVDLADATLRLVIEAEGFEFHGSRAGWRKDRRRFGELGAHRWWVLPFTWEDVMHRPDWVRWVIESWLAGGAVRAWRAPRSSQAC